MSERLYLIIISIIDLVCVCCSVPLLKNLPSNKIAKIADVLEMVSKVAAILSPMHPELTCITVTVDWIGSNTCTYLLLTTTVDQLVNAAFCDTENVHRWFTLNGLTLNPDESEAIVVGTGVRSRRYSTTSSISPAALTSLYLKVSAVW